jgi:hypothetical protein
MRQSLSGVRALARSLLEAEDAGAAVEEQVEAAERILRRLAERLSPLVGTGGFLMLVQRSLRRARSEHSWLATVEVHPDAPWRLAGMAGAATEAGTESALAAAQTVLAELIGLIARFLGADMAIRLVRQSMPELTGGGEAGDGPEENLHD